MSIKQQRVKISRKHEHDKDDSDYDDEDNSSVDKSNKRTKTLIESTMSSTSSTSTSSISSSASTYLSNLPNKRLRDLTYQIMVDCPTLQVELIGIITSYVIPINSAVVVAGVSIIYENGMRTAPIVCLKSSTSTEWSRMVDIPVPRIDFMMCTTYDDDIIMIAGGKDDSDVKSLQLPTLQYTINTGKWDDLASLPIPILSAANAVVFDEQTKISKWHIVGGRTLIRNSYGTNIRRIIDNHYQWNNETKSWITLPFYPARCWNMAAVSYMGSLVVSGGSTFETNYSDKVYRFDYSTNSWIPMPSLIHKRCMHSMVVHGNDLFVIGGTTYDAMRGGIERYSLESNQWELMPWTLPLSNITSAGYRIVDGILYLINTFDFFNGSMLPCWKADLSHPPRIILKKEVTLSTSPTPQTPQTPTTPTTTTTTTTTTTLRSDLIWKSIPPITPITPIVFFTL